MHFTPLLCGRLQPPAALRYPTCPAGRDAGRRAAVLNRGAATMAAGGVMVAVLVAQGAVVGADMEVGLALDLALWCWWGVAPWGAAGDRDLHLQRAQVV